MSGRSRGNADAGDVKQGGQTRQSKSAARSSESRPTRVELSGKGGKRGSGRSASARGEESRRVPDERRGKSRSSSASTGRSTSGRGRTGNSPGGINRDERGGRPMESVYGQGYGDESDRRGRRVVERDDRDWNSSARADEGRSIRGERGELGWRSESQRYADEGREHHPRRSGGPDEREFGNRDDRERGSSGFRRDDRQEGWQQSEEFGLAGNGPRARERGDFYRPPAGRDDGRWSGSGRYSDAQGGYHAGGERDDRRGFDDRYERGDDRRNEQGWSNRGDRETQGYGHRPEEFGGGDRGSQDFYRGRGARGEQDSRRGNGPSRRDFSQRSTRSGNRYE